MRLLKIAIWTAFSISLFSVPGNSQNYLTEPSTEKDFPAEVKFTYGSGEYSLSCTGLAVRKKFFFKVYGMAHYIEGMIKVKSEDVAYPAVLTEGKAKQIIMTFVRNVDAKTVRETYNEGFRNNSSAAEYNEMKSLVDSFLGYFSKDVKENDTFIFRWLPDGSVVVIINNEEKPAITGSLFARTLWSIWLGEDSVVDREDLVSRMIGTE